MARDTQLTGEPLLDRYLLQLWPAPANSGRRHLRDQPVCGLLAHPCPHLATVSRSSRVLSGQLG